MPVRSTAVLPPPLFRLGWHPMRLTHFVPKLWTEYQDPCPAHSCSSVPLPVPAWGRFELGDEWGHAPLSLALFKVLCSFSCSMSGSHPAQCTKAAGEHSWMAALQKSHDFWIILFSHAVWCQRGTYGPKWFFFPLYNSHILFHMRGIISCYGIYNPSHVYSSLPQDRQYTFCLSALKALRWS